MQIFNTLTRRKEEFVPQQPGVYRIYVCGPTVYNYIHIGNARPLIVFDTLRRYLEYRGNKVIYVSNITDIDDKLITRANEEGTTMQAVAQRFEAEYKKDAAGLNCLPPPVHLRQGLLQPSLQLLRSKFHLLGALLPGLGGLPTSAQGGQSHHDHSHRHHQQRVFIPLEQLHEPSLVQGQPVALFRLMPVHSAPPLS